RTPAVHEALCVLQVLLEDRLRRGGALPHRGPDRLADIGDGATELADSRGHPRELSFLAIDDVLVRVVDVVLPDEPRSRLVLQHHRELLAMELLEKREQPRHEFCFSLQVMQTRVQGMALSRAGAIGSPQSRHMPYVPFSRRQRASSIACRIFASVCFSFSAMWTSLLPLAWSAMSPWRVLLSIEACSGLIPPVPSISVRFLSSASLNVVSSVAITSVTPAAEPFPRARITSNHSTLGSDLDVL